MGFILILAIAGTSITTVPTVFPSKEGCVAAGQKAINDIGGGFNPLRYSCVEVK